MLALSWTALGILAAFALGVLALQASQNARIDALRDRMEAGFDGVAERFQRFDERFERLDAKVDQGSRELRDEIRTQGERFERGLEEHQARHHG